jgi:hypothetical protein
VADTLTPEQEARLAAIEKGILASKAALDSALAVPAVGSSPATAVSPGSGAAGPEAATGGGESAPEPVSVFDLAARGVGSVEDYAARTADEQYVLEQAARGRPPSFDEQIELEERWSHAKRAGDEKRAAEERRREEDVRAHDPKLHAEDLVARERRRLNEVARTASDAQLFDAAVFAGVFNYEPASLRQAGVGDAAIRKLQSIAARLVPVTPAQWGSTMGLQQVGDSYYAIAGSREEAAELRDKYGSV